MSPQNCWEAMHCGREPGGDRVAELGVCPAAIEDRVDGVNRGTKAGRACWAVAGTFCGGKVQGTFAQKSDCVLCPFYHRVVNEEAGDFVITAHIFQMLHSEDDEE